MVSSDDFELNFLILKFLREGTCPEAARLLEEELNKQCRGLLPSRLDWEGNPHHQTIQELERQYPHVGADHLAILCSRLRLRPGASHHSLLSHPLPRRPPPRICQPPGILSHHQLTGFQQSLSVYTIMYKRLRLLRRNLGHLSSVFCLLFDKTGQYVFTGADDLLVKMWSTHTGRLYFTFRGASSEISDMAVSEDNRMLAAGSTDKIIRVWCLLSAAPVAVLTKHTGTITALHFCPAAAPGVPPYLAATSGDGTVSFWRFSYKDKSRNRAIFDPEPTRYHEKMRPGNCQMICANFSPGGLFLATGSADHHVRVYMMDGKDGPVKVLEEEAHTERVDSIQWGNSPLLRFISGSKDGTARLWSYRAGHWSNVELRMTAEDGRTVHYIRDKNVEETLRVTMVSWNSNDTKVITAVSDSSLCVWDPVTAVMIARLKGHKDEVYVLEPHPSRPEFLMSGAHDGNLIIWDISTHEILFQHYNNIDGQGHGAVYDAKWSPDSLNIAASDSHGHILFFGMTSKQPYEACPTEMFFHTDYRPLLRDTSHHVVDEQTQCAPHLLPPPFLVDIEGNPYPADIQKLVPGREHLSDKEALVPNLTDTETDGSRPRSPPPPTEQQQQQPQPPAEPVRSNIDDLIRELAGSADRPESAASTSQASGDASNGAANNGEAPPNPQVSPIVEHSYAAAARRGSSASTGSGEVDVPGPVQRAQERPPPSVQVFPAPASQQLVGSIWRRRELVPPFRFRGAKDDHVTRREFGLQERMLYKLESLRKRHVSGQGQGHRESDEVIDRRRGRGAGRRRGRGARTQAAVRQPPSTGRPPPTNRRRSEPQQDDEESLESEHSEDEEFRAASVASASDSSLSESDMEATDSTSSESTEYSDWGANNLTPPKRTARKSGRISAPSQPVSTGSEGDGAGEASTSKKPDPIEPEPGPSQGPSQPKRKKRYTFDPTNLEEIPPEYLPSAWLADYIPKKSPYFPQMGDEVMYFKQGHIGYINLVKHRFCYKLNMKEQHWLKRSDIRNVELVKVIGMKYEIRPPRLCCLKLAIMDPQTNQLTGDNFSIKYHDMNDVVDFLVLRHNFEAAMEISWEPSYRYRCQIDESWWFGTVSAVSPFDELIPDSPFLSFMCNWDNGEEERLSPWDLDQLGDDGVGRTRNDDPVQVTREEFAVHLYEPMVDEWRGLNSKVECERISKGLEKMMALAIAEPFNYPVDLTLYPDYMLEIEYPMDFSLIKSRLDNLFYRRITAVQFDVRYIATNTECYNRPRTDIVRNGRILTDLVLKIIQDPHLEDIMGEYHQLMGNFKWEDTLEAKKERPGRKTPVELSPLNPKQWKHDCNELLNKMFRHEDSEPFREPVSEIDFPDYHRVVAAPIDLTTVRESLRVGEYDDPLSMQKDVMLIFKNSFAYNVNKSSDVIKMTTTLKAFFLDEFQSVVKDWRLVKRRMNANIKSGRSPTTPSATPVKKGKKRTDRDEDEGDETDDEPKKSRGSKRRIDSFDSDDSEDVPKKKDRRGKVKGKRKPEVNYGEDTEDEDDSHKPRPGRQRRKPAKYVDDDDTEDEPMPRKSTKRKREATNKSKKRKRPSSTFDDEEKSDTEETAPWTSDDDGSMRVKKVRRKKRGGNNEIENEAGPSHRGLARESDSPAASGSNCNTNVRPRRNVRPKVVQDSETENEELVNLKIKKKSSQGRARRQATEKALIKSGESDTDESHTKNRGGKASLVIRSEEEDIDEAGSLAVTEDDGGTAENVVNTCDNTSDTLEMSENKSLKRNARTASKFPKRESAQLESSNVSPSSIYPSLPGSSSLSNSSTLPTSSLITPSSSLPMYTSLPGSSHEHSADGNASSSGRPLRAKTLPPKLRDDDVIAEDVRKKKMSKKKSSIKKSNEWLDREVGNIGKSPKKKKRKVNSTSSSESNSNRVAGVNSQNENELKSDKSNPGASRRPETESQVGDSYEGFESEGGLNAASRSQRTAKSNIKYVDESGSETSLNKLEKKHSKTKKIRKGDHRNLDESSEGEMYDPSAHVSSRPGRTSKLKCKKETSEVNDEESDGEISRNVRDMEPDIEQSNVPIQGRSAKKKVKKKRKQNLDEELGVSGPEAESDGDAGTVSSRFGRSIKTHVKYREPESESDAETKIKITKRKTSKKKYEENDVVQELDAIIAAEESEEDVGHISSRSGRPIKANIKYIEGDSESDNIKDKPPKKKTKKKKTKSKDLDEQSDVNFSDGATQDDIGHAASRSGRTIKANVKYNEGETESDIESKDKPSKKKIKKKMSKPKYVEESDASELEIGKISSRSGRTVNANVEYVEGDSESDTLPRDKAHKKKSKKRSIAKDSNEEESDVNYSEELVENGSAQVSSRSGRPIKANVKYVEGESESDIAEEIQANKKKSKKKRFSEKESESREFESDSFPSTKRKRPKKTSTNEENGHVPDRSSRPKATVKYNDDTEDTTDESDIHPAKRRNIGKGIEMELEEPEQLLESDSRDNNELKSEDFEDSSEGETSDSDNVPLSQRKPRGRKRRTSGGVGQVDDVLANLDALDSVLSNLSDHGLEDLQDEENEVEEEGSSSDYGKRRGRKRDTRDRQAMAPRLNTRPQRAGGFSRNNLRESTDEDLPPKRARSQRISPIGSRSRQEEEEDFGNSSTSDEEAAEPAGGISGGVSSRGRVRKPNPKHL